MKNDIYQRARQRLDDRLVTLKPPERFKAPPKGWIRAIRDALGMTGGQLAARIGIRAQSVDAMEKSEVSGTVQLQTLRRAAEALDCTLVYALVPNSSLQQAVDERAEKLALKALSQVAHSMKLEAQGTGKARLQERVRAYVRERIKDRDLWNEP